MMPPLPFTFLFIILLANSIQASPLPDDQGRDKRNVVADPQRRWPDGIVPYEIEPGLPASYLNSIEAGMGIIEHLTCVQFIQRNDSRVNGSSDYVSIIASQTRECNSEVGKRGGEQWMVLAPACLTPETIIHELMHTLGFSHEQSRADRDKYVEIIKQNIKKGYEQNFEMTKPQEYDDLGLPYDPCSILHYPSGAFAKKRKGKTHPTIKFRPGVMKICPNTPIAQGDIRKIRHAYNCPDKW